ncbi:MAG: TonB C-terminal domain-containing protein [Verrucomicrobia bacterium]|nr:TonB C-terminal domain-containing protein [Verrucomicrobiota bacterium]
MNEEHRLEPNGGFKMVLAVITAAHLLMLGGFLTLSLHPLKRIDQERMDQELVWVNPGSFTGDAPGKTDGAPAVRAAPSTPSPPLVGGDEPPPDAAPVTTPAGPEEAPPSAPTPAPVEPVPPPEETPPPLPPLPARSDLGLATPNPPPMPKPVSKSRPKPIPSVTPKPKPSANATPKPKPKPSPSAIPKARTTPKPKPSPKPVPEASPETAANPKPPSRPKAGLMAKNGDKAPRAGRVDDGDGGTVGSPGGAGDGTGAGQAAGNGESKLAYYAEVIKNRFQAAWNQPRGEIAAGTELVATVRLRIQPDGAVTEFVLIEGSGNSVVDESVREAGRKITHLPPPPGGNGFNPVVRFELGD